MKVIKQYNLEFINGKDMKILYNTNSSDINNETINLLNSLKLTEKLWYYNNNLYKILHYDKSFLTNDMVNTIGIFRSLLIDNKNKIISFSPPKSLKYDLFKSQNDNIKEVNVEEYVEGTMINLFWNNIEWEISTKNTIGGKIIFFQNEDKQLTFRNMFNEICNYVGLDYENLNKEYCYSFVMQHPKNRIVIPFFDMKLYW